MHVHPWLSRLLPLFLSIRSVKTIPPRRYLTRAHRRRIMGDYKQDQATIKESHASSLGHLPPVEPKDFVFVREHLICINKKKGQACHCLDCFKALSIILLLLLSSTSH